AECGGWGRGRATLGGGPGAGGCLPGPGRAGAPRGRGAERPRGGRPGARRPRRRPRPAGRRPARRPGRAAPQDPLASPNGPGRAAGSPRAREARRRVGEDGLGVSSLLIATPMGVEALLVRSGARRARVRRTGMGPRRARAAAPALLAEPGETLLVLGFFGGLHDDVVPRGAVRG